MPTGILKACGHDVLEALLPGICVPVCSALLSTVSWVDSEELEPTLSPAGTIHGGRREQVSTSTVPGTSLSPPGRTLGLPAEHRLVSSLSSFSFCTLVKVNLPLLPKSQERWEHLVLVLVYSYNFEKVTTSKYFLFSLSEWALVVLFSHQWASM